MACKSGAPKITFKMLRAGAEAAASCLDEVSVVSQFEIALVRLR